MKKQCLLLLLLLATFCLHAQKISMEFGNISQYEMDYTTCDFDSVAEAVVLFDVGKSRFVHSENGFNIRFTRHKRLKVLDNAGVDYAQIEIPFYHKDYSYEKVSNIKAVSFNFEDGVPRKTELPNKDWFVEKVNENWDVLKFAIPDVKKGTVIEYSYELETPFKFHLPDWEFQDRIPIIYSKYEVRMVPFFEYISLLKGAKKYDENKAYVAEGMERHFGGVDFRDMVYEFGMHNVPAFRDEELISSRNDYLLQLDFQLAQIKYPTGGSSQIMSTWPKIVDELEGHEEFGKFVKRSKKTAEDLLDVAHLQSMPEQERFNAVMQYVKGNYNWNEWYGQRASKTVKELLNDKYGSAADLNLLAVGLLQACNLEVYPVWISTRGHGKIPYDYPFTHFFNYVLIYAKIDGQNVLTDATDEYLPNDRIPLFCINDLGLVINSDNEEVSWIKLKQDIPSKAYVQYKLKVKDAKIKAEVSKMTTEYDACYYRKNFGVKEERFKEEAQKTGYVFTDESLKTKTFEALEKPYIFSYNVETDAVSLNDKIYVPPFLNDVISDNPLKQKVRNYPVDFTIPKIRSFTSYVQIPEGYEASYIPSNLNISNDLVKIKYTTMLNDGYLVCTFEYHVKQAIYYAEDYHEIQEMFNQVISKGNDKIVLTKL